MSEYLDVNVPIPPSSQATTAYGGTGYSWQRVVAFGAQSELSGLRMRGALLDKNGNEILAGGTGSGSGSTGPTGPTGPGASGAPANAFYLTQVANMSLPNAVVIGTIGTGILEINGSGGLAIAEAGRSYYGPGQPTQIQDNGEGSSFYIGTNTGGDGNLGNLGVGYGTLALVTSGDKNTAVGYNALSGVETGSDNSAFGYLAGMTGSNSLNNTTAIGANASVAASNSLILGNNACVGIGNPSPTYALDIISQTNAPGVIHMGGINTSETPVTAPAAFSGCLYFNSGKNGFDAISSQDYRSGNVLVGNQNVNFGSASLVSGTARVYTDAVTTGCVVLVSYETAGVIPGYLSAPTLGQVAGSYFTINSSSGTDNGTVSWYIINP